MTHNSQNLWPPAWLLIGRPYDKRLIDLLAPMDQ